MKEVKCGDNAVISYDPEDCSNLRMFYINGTGAIDCSNFFTTSGYDGWVLSSNCELRIFIKEGITEICDNSFQCDKIKFISLPNTLKKIGSKCFIGITQITLPESLETIGHNNFAYRLTSVNIPKNVKNFPLDNIQGKPDLHLIKVSEENEYYTSVDGVLYTKDLTEVLICPGHKEGNVCIPPTVSKIGDYCFHYCTKLTNIVIPNSVKSIGKSAFNHSVIGKLVLPNNIDSIGEAAFFYAKIGQFKAPSRLTEYNDNCFCGTSFNNFKISDNTTYIGYRCFESARLDENIHIEKCTHIGEEAFRNYSCAKRNIHLSSAIKYIGKNCFMGNDEVNLFIHSIYPPHLDEIPDLSSAKRIILHVPKGFSHIYKRSSCWNIFNEIKEMDFSDNIDIAQKELFYILESIQNVDREYVKGIIEDISSDYTLIEDDDDYMDILDLIKYNRKFSPTIHPFLEIDVFKKCTTTFKLRLMKDVFRTMDLPLQLYAELEKSIVSHVITEEQSLLIIDKYSSISKDYDVYFDNILNVICECISNASSSIKIAVSWFTNHQLFSLIKEKSENGINIQLIINNDLINNGGYCLNFNELIKSGVQLHIVEYPQMLHHKFCIIDNKIVINGSYNWTRFSANNYENIMIVKNLNSVERFISEFEKLTSVLPIVANMPVKVPERPEYDRSSFKQFITEELDSHARETSDHREKITAIKKATSLNREYLKMIDPVMLQEYEESEINNTNKTIKEIESETYSLVIDEKQEEANRLVEENSILTRQIEELDKNIKTLELNPDVEQDIIDSIEKEQKNIQRKIGLNQVQIDAKQTEIQNIKQSSTIETLGGRGSLKINLKWNTYDDLDLHVTDPDNHEIYYSNKSATCQGVIGKLDIDANAGNHKSKTPQENIFWDDKAPLGLYSVDVVYFSKKDIIDKVDYIVTIYPEKGMAKTFTGSFYHPNEKNNIVKFKISEVGIEYIDK